MYSDFYTSERSTTGQKPITFFFLESLGVIGTASAPEHFLQHWITDLLSLLEGMVCLEEDILVHGITHENRLTAVLQ